MRHDNFKKSIKRVRKENLPMTEITTNHKEITFILEVRSQDFSKFDFFGGRDRTYQNRYNCDLTTC